MKYTLESGVSVMVGLTENNEIKIINNTYANMDYLYIIKEAGELDYRGNKFNVEAGDIVVKLYKNNGSCDDREIVIIPAKVAAPWVKNVEESEARERATSICSCPPKTVAQDEVPVSDEPSDGIA